MRSWTRVGACAGAILASAVWSTAAVATFEGANGLIAYSGGDPGELTVRVVDPTATAPTKLGDIRAVDPVFNAQGTKVAFASVPVEPAADAGCDPDEQECRGEHELYVMNVDGSGLRAVTDSRLFETSPSWNPAGTKLVYANALDDTLRVLTLASGESETITSGGIYAFPDWSADGTQIAAERLIAGDNYDIVVMDSAGGNERNVTQSESNTDRFPSLAPDGSTIAFWSYRPAATTGIYTIPAASSDGTGDQLLYTGTAFAPAFSPDGTAVAFSRTNPASDSSDLMTAPVSGGGAAVLPVSTASGFYDEWMGSWQALPVLEEVEQDAAADGTVVMGSEASAATPLILALTTPNAGSVLIQRIDPVATPPRGFSLLGHEFRLDAPAASTAAPLEVAFTLDASAVPGGETAATLAVLRDGAAVPACTGAGATPDPCVSERTTLGDGDVRITVLSSHASAWNLAAPDDEPPQTAITSGPRGTTSKRTPSFRFRSSEPRSTFRCRVDRAPFKPCDSPTRTKRLRPGGHRFEVRATDEARNTDPTPATRSFKVAR